MIAVFFRTLRVMSLCSVATGPLASTVWGSDFGDSLLTFTSFCRHSCGCDFKTDYEELSLVEFAGRTCNSCNCVLFFQEFSRTSTVVSVRV